MQSKSIKNDAITRAPRSPRWVPMGTPSRPARPRFASFLATAALLASAPLACSPAHDATGSDSSDDASASVTANLFGDINECLTDNGGCGDPALFACRSATAAPPACEFLPAKDHAALTQGITSIDVGGALPSALVVYGDTAFPVAVDAAHNAYIAAARVGAGKVVHYGHDAFLGDLLYADLGAATLLLNTLAWMSPAKKPTVGVQPGLYVLAEFLTRHGFTVRTTTPSNLSGIDVYCMNSHTDYPDADVQKISAFMQSGGGLVSAGLAWWWGNSHTQAAENYPGNKYLRTAGIGVTTATSDSLPDRSDRPISPLALSDVFHARKALSRLVEHVSRRAQLPFADQDIAADTVVSAIDFFPLSFTDYFTAANVLKEKTAPVVPTKANPLFVKDHPIKRLVVHIDHKYANESPPDEVKAHLAAADFPGAVPAGAMAISKTITIDGNYAGRDSRFGGAHPTKPVWRSTGVYAPAGKKIHVKIDAAAAGKGLAVLLGAHTDTLWESNTWSRFPAISRSFPLDAPEIDTASAFGGLVYVQVPVGSKLGPVTVTIEGGVGAPLFQLGETSLTAWQSVERSLPGPWAEITSDKFSITVPSAAIAALTNPNPVLGLWGGILDADADLAGIPRARPRAERILVDRQISNGYMHSGYPIMAGLDVQNDLVSLSRLMAGSWGPLHELGHNHQWDPWALPGSIEASVNLWSVYAFEKVLGIPRGNAMPDRVADLAPAERAKRIQDYLAGGANFADKWKEFTALETYLQLQEGFGWEPFTQVFKQYYADAPNTDPTNDQDKIDKWVLRFSLAVNKDLGPFFRAWGFPVSAGVLAEIGTLPAWEENPMP
ncbi:M60 family metallopeptidase [Sorangium sp. So ce291]|uniref:M60 family metallopeptidase n=1 Tax=Sorangium sp. So ce291 TaxID=3133294 RepID=UPI003F6181C2